VEVFDRYAPVMVEEGKPAPDFRLETDEGETVSLADFKGRPLVLYFYPKDDTPGCTTQACGIRDSYGELQARGAAILGVSADDVESHRKFREKYSLPFPLLSDPDRRLIDAYGLWQEKKYMGKTYMGIVRSTVIVDENGNVKKFLPNVKPDQHVDLLLANL
jgi:thioredoxin-dependent peroxiredoxin